MKQKNKKRLLAQILSVVMVFSMVGGGTAFATETTALTGICEHHKEHTKDCGYSDGTEGNPCSHAHDADCYKELFDCSHVHDASCYENTDVATESEATKLECPHIHDADCYVEELDCRHRHDDECGYIKAESSASCKYICEICSADNGIPNDKPECNDILKSSALLDELLKLQKEQQEMIDLSGTDAYQTDEFKLLDEDINKLWEHVDKCEICKNQLQAGGAYHSKFYGVSTTAAPDYTLYYSGEKLYQGDPSNNTLYTEQGAKWSASGDTLTLNGFTFSTSAETALVVPEDTVITLVGANSISGDLFGIEGEGNLTIQGSGSLRVSAANTVTETISRGISIDGDGDLTISKANVTVVAGSSKTGIGIYVDEMFIEDNAKVTAVSSSTTRAGYGISARMVTLRSGSLKLQGTDTAIMLIEDPITLPANTLLKASKNFDGTDTVSTGISFNGTWYKVNGDDVRYLAVGDTDADSDSGSGSGGDSGSGSDSDSGSGSDSDSGSGSDSDSGSGSGSDSGSGSGGDSGSGSGSDSGSGSGGDSGSGSGSGSSGGSSSDSSSSAEYTSLPENYSGKTKIIGNVRVPDYTVEGTWNKDAEGRWQLYDTNGNVCKDGWVVAFNPYANLQSGQKAFSWFLFDKDGNMITGWYVDEQNETYYLNPEEDNMQGSMALGWRVIDGKYYYFDESTEGKRGRLLKGVQTPDGYYVDENGVWNGKEK